MLFVIHQPHGMCTSNKSDAIITAWTAALHSVQVVTTCPSLAAASLQADRLQPETAVFFGRRIVRYDLCQAWLVVHATLDLC